MAESYSIGEAARVLGVPQRRIWQLVERGVLVGALDERRRWRIYLGAGDEPAAVPPAAGPAAPAPSAAPAPPAASAAGSTGSTAASGQPPGNGSYFRELLAELRHLQERYGQALLALGEARGEAAALKARLELLEGGRDVVLPAPAPPDAVAPVPPLAPVDAAPPAASGRVRQPRRATQTARRRADGPAAAPRRFGRAGVADALARAEDPSVPELPGGREAAEALANLGESAVAPAGAPATQPTMSAVGPGSTEDRRAPNGPVAVPVSAPAAPLPAGSAAATPPGRGLAGRLRRWMGR